MARRDLLAEAQATAAAQVAPQLLALNEALQQARVDRNSAISAASTAYGGLSGAIHRAGPQVKRVYSNAAQSAQGSDVISRQALAGLPSSPGVDTIKAAYAHEGAVGGAVVAKALASRLADLSDRRIAAAAGRAFQVGRANSDYSAAAATNASKRQGVAAQQGLYTGAAFSKLEEAAAGRANARNLLRTRLQSDASLQAQRLNSQADLQAQRLTSQETVAGARLRSSEHTSALGRRQAKLGRIDQAKRQQTQIAAADRRAAATGGPSGIKPTSDHVYKGRTAIELLTSEYQSKGPGQMHQVAADARKKGYPEPLIGAAADRASKGYVSPENVRKLEALGYSVPKEWTGVQIPAHTRRRRGK